MLIQFNSQLKIKHKLIGISSMQITKQTLSLKEDQSQQIKNEVARILHSDHSQIQCAIQSKIQSIDECLTSRSNFISMFQQMLKKEMGIKRDQNQDQHQKQQDFKQFDEYQSLQCKNLKSDIFQTKQQFSTNSENIPFKTKEYTSRLLQQKQNFIQKESQAQTARQFQAQNSFVKIKKQIWQSSFGFTSRESEFSHQITLNNQDNKSYKSKIQRQYLVISTSALRQLLSKSKDLTQNLQQIKQFCFQQLKVVKLQMKQLVCNSLNNIVEIINSIYQKKIQQLLEQTQKFKNQTKRLKQQISFRNLANSSFFNQDSQNQFSFQSSKANLKESQRSDCFQNQFANIPTPQINCSSIPLYQIKFPIVPQIQIKTNFNYRNQPKINNSIAPLSNFNQKYSNNYSFDFQKNLSNIENMSHIQCNQTFLQPQCSNFNSLENSFNSISSNLHIQAPKNQWKQIKFSLKKSEKQNQFSKNKNYHLTEYSQCNQKKSYNNFYDFEPLNKVQIKYPPILDGFASISQENLSYKGNWKNGLMHGKGKLLTNSFAYEGEFWYGSFQGTGTYKTKALQYIGQFKNHKIDGSGFLILKKQKIQGLWRQNKFIRRS